MTLNHFTLAPFRAEASLTTSVFGDLSQPALNPASSPHRSAVWGSIDPRGTDLNNRSPRRLTVSGEITSAGDNNDWRSAASVNRNGTAGSHRFLHRIECGRARSHTRGSDGAKHDRDTVRNEYGYSMHRWGQRFAHPLRLIGMHVPPLHQRS